MSAGEVTILVVDDDRVDIMALKRCFRALGVDNPIVTAGNGLEALALLRGEGGQPRLRQPCLVLLDLNMPRMGGLEFLAELRSDPALRRMVVFVMTTSDDEQDRARSFDRNVAGYVLKHRPGQSFQDAVGMLQQYWRIVEFPDFRCGPG
jgi:CheY-like chemotaxis protein